MLDRNEWGVLHMPVRELILPWRTPPTEIMFLAQACGREFRGMLVAPAFDWLWVHGMS